MKQKLTLKEYNAKQIEWMRVHAWHLGEKLKHSPSPHEFLDSWEASHLAEEFASIYEVDFGKQFEVVKTKETIK